MSIAHALLVSRASIASALLAGAVAAGAVYALESAAPVYESELTFLNTPLSGTGEPDRVLATEASVLESRSLKEQVAAELGVPVAGFALAAEPARLAFAMDLTVQSADPALAQAAATTAFAVYTDRVAVSPAPTTAVTPLDAATPARRTRDPLIDAALAFVAGVVVGAGAIALLRALRPRVRARYGESPAPVPLVGIPARRGRHGEVDALASALRGSLVSMATRMHPAAPEVHLVVVPVGRGAADVAFRAVSQVQQVRPSRSRSAGARSQEVAVEGETFVTTTGLKVFVRVTEDRAGLLDVDGERRGAVVGVVLARAVRDLESDLRRTVASVSPLAATVVAVTGSHDNGVVLPAATATTLLDPPPPQERRRIVRASHNAW